MDEPRPSARSGHRAVYACAAAFYLFLFVAVMWPIYPRFAGIEPRVLSMPFSLAYVVAALIASFLVLLALYAWERRGSDGAVPGGEGAQRPRSGAGSARPPADV